MAFQTFYNLIVNNLVIDLEIFSIFVKELCAKGKVNELETVSDEMCRRSPVPM